jgi:hypothetical protein
MMMFTNICICKEEVRQYVYNQRQTNMKTKVVKTQIQIKVIKRDVQKLSTTWDH